MEALATKELERVAVDTTMQPKAIAHSTDAGLAHKAIEKLVGFVSARASRLGPEGRRLGISAPAPQRAGQPSVEACPGAGSLAPYPN
jgi:hypothetical protein